MKQINKGLIIIACFAISSAHAKQTGARTTSSRQPTTTTTTLPALQTKQTIFDTMPTYAEILALLNNKKPTISKDFVNLQAIEEEAKYKLQLIKQESVDVRAKIFDIKTANQMRTYHDIEKAFKQRSADPADFEILKDIKSAAKRQLKEFKQGNPTYREILSTLQNTRPTSSDLATLNNIILEATDQRDQLK